MDSINDALADVLRTVRTPGDFCAARQCPMHVPLIEVDGVGPIALALLPTQAEQLIARPSALLTAAVERPWSTPTVRRTWQIGADRIRIEGQEWARTLADHRGASRRRARSDRTVCVPEFYKLLVYDQGSHFVSHRDTEKAPGMFATLIIALPSLHAGGELLVRHKGPRSAAGCCAAKIPRKRPSQPSMPTACTRCCR